jgi:hypothetical protein
VNLTDVTVTEEEFRSAILGRVASFALVGRNIAFRPSPAAIIDIVMLIGWSIRPEV